jgi:hypothetical protein
MTELSEERIAEIEHDLFDDMNGDGGYCLHIYRAPISAIFACYHALAAKLKEATQLAEMREGWTCAGCGLVWSIEVHEQTCPCAHRETWKHEWTNSRERSLVGKLAENLATIREATNRAATWERLHDHRTAELDAKDKQIATLTKERDDAVAAMRTVLTSLKDEFKAANEERLKETHDAHTEANRWKAEGDMYGWNFHEGRAGGTIGASHCFYRVYRKLVAALSVEETKSEAANAQQG